jgi:outer membrane biosynthesis protein TonB
MGVENPEFVEMLVKFFSTTIGIFWLLCFCDGLAGNVLGSVLTGDGNQEPAKAFKRGLQMSTEDMYAIATGDEEYLAAHCTLPAPPKPKKRRESAPKQQKPKQQKPKQQKPKQQKPKQQKPKPVEPAKPVGPSDELLNDCVDALVSLGTKSAEARRVATKFLVANPRLKTVEAFIPEIFKKR